jgi:hypothetical protein
MASPLQSEILQNLEPQALAYLLVAAVHGENRLTLTAGDDEVPAFSGPKGAPALCKVPLCLAAVHPSNITLLLRTSMTSRWANCRAKTLAQGQSIRGGAIIMPSKQSSSRERTRRYRERMRAKALRIELWVPDTRAPGFAEEAHRQALALANSPYEAEDQAFVDAISIDLDELDK